jgi:beta-glucosidase
MTSRQMSLRMASRVSIAQLILGIVVFLLARSVPCGAQAPSADSAAIEAQARAWIAELSPEQKIELLGGEEDMFTRAAPAIGLPRFKMSDGPEGVRTWGPSTAYAGGAALAASWDPELARRIGEALGRDARARSVNFLLAPGVNIARSPLDGRNFEYFSEDPFLTAAMAVPYIKGVQSQGVVATVKHYAANNQEYNRHNVSSDVDERTLREIYLPAFEAAVTRADVGAVMSSYNLINGVHATESEYLNLKVLKGDWRFQGILMSDWDATYDTVRAANNGLDLEMPSPHFMNARALEAAVHDGQVKESTINDKLMRIFRIVLRYHFIDRPQFDPANSTYSVADREVALDSARESLTLLKNEGHLLPLDPSKIKTIAVIGPNAYPAVTGGAGSSNAQAFEPVSTLTGIANLVGPNVHVLYSPGIPKLIDVFRQTPWDGAVQVDTYSNKDFQGTPQREAPSTVADFNPNGWDEADKSPRSIRYKAIFKATKSGKYMVVAASSGSDHFKVMVDGREVLTDTDADPDVPKAHALELQAGETVHVAAEYLPRAPGLRFGLGVSFVTDLISEDAKKFAALADVAVVTVGFNPATEGEGFDRTFALPWAQDALIETIAQINPRTVVTLTGGGGVETRAWLTKVPALLHLYYPGQEGGTAVAEVLLGKRNPEGKLPVTFDNSWEENPSAPHYYPIKGADTLLHVTETDGKEVDLVIPHVKYGDRLMVGYRYWTTSGKHPLFPFGFGLSYTTFLFSNLSVPSSAPSGADVQVNFDITNTGYVDGAEVAQLYVSDPSAKAERPERELKGFEKVRLAPGETKHVTLNLDARAFSYWDETSHKWIIDPGKFIIRVGDSSENTPLSADLILQ